MEKKSSTKDYVKELIEKKIDYFKGKDDEKSKKEFDKFSALNRLFNNQYVSFIEKIELPVAISILKDIGVSEEEAMNTYIALLKERMSEKYILIDPKKLKKEER